MTTRTYRTFLAVATLGAVLLLAAGCGAGAPAAEPSPPEAAAVNAGQPTATTAPPAAAPLATAAQAAQAASAANPPAVAMATEAPASTVPAATVSVAANAPAPTAMVEAQPTEPATAVRQEPATEVPPPPVSVPIGTSEGERVPDFALDLADGSTVTSAQLLEAGQPTFLFFLATW
jgi:hypothetical protein